MATKLSGISIIAGIVPGTDEDTFPTHYSEYGKGGWHEVATASNLDNIPAQRLTEGMAVYVKNEATVYILTSRSDEGINTWTALLKDCVTSSDVDNKISALGSIFTFKGTVAESTSLPTTNNTYGDVWHVSSDNSEWVYIEKTENGVETGTWEELGRTTTVDLRGYLKSTDIEAITDTEINGLLSD